MQYRKPARLSDPMNDFSPEELAGILSKKDSELDWRDFDRLFQGSCPPGLTKNCAIISPLPVLTSRIRRTRATSSNTFPSGSGITTND